MMNKQILVIDDNKGILEMVEVVLDESGFSVKSCTRADHVFENIEEYKPGLALMDYIL